MTIAAAFAIHPRKGTSQIGVFADARATLASGWEDGQDKLLPLSPRCCAVGSGPAQPLIAAARRTVAFLKRRPLIAYPPLSLWYQAGIFFRALESERARLSPQKGVFALVAGFASNGVPLVAEASFADGASTLMLFRPMDEEMVARVVGVPAAAPLFAEALRMDFAQGRGSFENTMSLLRDVSDDTSPSMEAIGGLPGFGVCYAGQDFSYPICEMEGRLFRRGAAVDPGDVGEEPVQRLTYHPQVFQDLDTRNQASPFFTGGAPLVSWLDLPPLTIGDPGIFKGNEPIWLLDERRPVPMIIAAGEVKMGGLHTLTSGMAPEESQSVERHTTARTSTKTSKKRK